MPWEPVPLTGTSSKAISTTSTFRRTLCSYRCPSSLAVQPSYSRYAQPPQCRTEPKRQVSCPNDRFDFSFQRIFLTSNRNFLSNYKVVSKLVWHHFWFSVSFFGNCSSQRFTLASMPSILKSYIQSCCQRS